MIAEEEGGETATVSGDLAVNPNALKKDEETLTRRKKMSKKNVIKENDNFTFFKDGDTNIFEIHNEQDINVYHQGLKKGSPKFWRQNSTTSEMMDTMNQNRSRNFIVRTDLGDSYPISKGF